MKSHLILLILTCLYFGQAYANLSQFADNYAIAKSCQLFLQETTGSGQTKVGLGDFVDRLTISVIPRDESPAVEVGIIAHYYVFLDGREIVTGIVNSYGPFNPTYYLDNEVAELGEDNLAMLSGLLRLLIPYSVLKQVNEVNQLLLEKPKYDSPLKGQWAALNLSNYISHYGVIDRNSFQLPADISSLLDGFIGRMPELLTRSSRKLIDSSPEELLLSAGLDPEKFKFVQYIEKQSGDFKTNFFYDRFFVGRIELRRSGSHVGTHSDIPLKSLRRRGLGALMYITSIYKFFEKTGYKRIVSNPGRSPEADLMWKKLVKSGYAKKTRDDWFWIDTEAIMKLIKWTHFLSGG